VSRNLCAEGTFFLRCGIGNCWIKVIIVYVYLLNFRGLSCFFCSSSKVNIYPEKWYSQTRFIASKWDNCIIPQSMS
jgi:hypothetical protein